MTDLQQPPSIGEAVDEHTTLTVRKPFTTLLVDRTSQRWIVKDPEGRFWALPQMEDSWKHRQPFQPTDETTLEPVPGHYKHFLGVPR